MATALNGEVVSADSMQVYDEVAIGTARPLSDEMDGITHHLMGFLRFSELKNGVLFSTIHPKNHALPILAEHFTDRFPQENFIIFDETRNLAAVHRADKNYMLVDASDLNQDIIHNYSDKEQDFRDLWLTFFDSVAITARINPKLQAQNIPKRYWGDALELAR